MKKGVIVLCLCLTMFPAGAFAQAANVYYVAPGGDDDGAGTSDAPFATLEYAASIVGPGDTVIVRPGHYAGFSTYNAGTPEAPITFRGEPGAVIDSGSWRDRVSIEFTDYVIFEGFEVAGAERAGVAVLGEADAPVKGVIVRNVHSHHNGVWGIFTAYAESVTIESCETHDNAEEHGIYVSNSADSPIIRGNRVHHNGASGIQINADPGMDGDGIISNALVEKNIIYENGVFGAAAINLASVRGAVIQNNLLYGNFASGIAAWDDDFGAEWGSKENKFFHNTVIMAPEGRFALSLKHGSTGSVVLNNILLHPGERGSIEVDDTSEEGFSSDHNIFSESPFGVALDAETWIDFAAWQARGYDGASQVVQSAALLDDAFRPAAGSVAIDAGYDLSGLVPDDLDGAPRPQGAGFDIGAYEYGGPVQEVEEVPMEEPPVPPSDAAPVSVELREGLLWVALSDGRAVGVPVSWYPALESASVGAFSNMQLEDDAVFWPDLDLRIKIHDILCP